MALFLPLNDVTTALASSLASGAATSAAVTTGDGALFASATVAKPIRCGFFDATTGALKEIIDVTGRSTDTLTIVRAVEDATRFAAGTWTTGTVLAAVDTVAALNGQYAPSSFGSVRSVVGATTDLVVPGVAIAAVNQTTGGTANTIYYMPCYLTEPKTLLTLNIEVNVLFAGSNIKLGLYTADSTWQPAALILDSGNISSATTGKKTYTPTATPLAAGPYLAAVQCDSGTVLYRAWQGGGLLNQPLNGSTFGTGQNIIRGSWRKALTFAAYTNPGTAWDTSSDGASTTSIFPLIGFGF